MMVIDAVEENLAGDLRDPIRYAGRGEYLMSILTPHTPLRPELFCIPSSGASSDGQCQDVGAGELGDRAVRDVEDIEGFIFLLLFSVLM
jgi:hypothetical protein